MDIEVISIKSLTCPQGRVLEHRITLECSEMVELCKYLTHVQITFIGRPVIGAFHSIGDGNREFGTGAVLRIKFLRQVYAHVGVVFITESPDGTTD
ncbi:hypothetical protein D3C76_1275240 [compost metagenome]